MPAYATLRDLADAATGGWTELAQRASVDPAVTGELMQATAEGADRSQWAPEAQAAADAALERLQDALERASRHADTYLFPRYRTVMPLSTDLVQGSSLPGAVATIALKRLYGTSVPEELRRGAQWADDYLRDLAAGKISLGAADTEVPQPAGRMVSRTQAKTFDWERY